MLAFLEDVGFQFILLLVAGLIWLVGRLVQGASKLRERTRLKMEREERRTSLDFRGEVAGTEAAAMPLEPAVGEEPEKAKLVLEPPAPPRPPRRPPRPRRVVKRVKAVQPVSKAAPKAPAPAIDVKRLLRGDPKKLREAIVIREVLGPPLAIRRRRGRQA